MIPPSRATTTSSSTSSEMQRRHVSAYVVNDNQSRIYEPFRHGANFINACGEADLALMHPNQLLRVIHYILLCEESRFILSLKWLCLFKQSLLAD